MGRRSAQIRAPLARRDARGRVEPEGRGVGGFPVTGPGYRPVRYRYRKDAPGGPPGAVDSVCSRLFNLSNT
ncbi:hypothetical protein HBB16_13685 [Pseudonocardia sp. MCCB 268]|nr:hypothetical protein [Pseudonocardia cytotoxica]